MNETLMQVIVDYVMFLQLTDETRLDPDLAVEQTEQVAWRLKQLPSAEQAEFVKYVSKLASQAERETGRDQRWQCLMDMPEAMGLTG